MKRLTHSIISYTLIASIFITGAGIDLPLFRFYWYYPFYIVFLVLGFFSFRKVGIKPLLVLIIISAYSLLTFQSGLSLVVKQIVNIGFSWLTFYFFICHEKYDLAALFEKYVRFAKVMAVLGLVQVVMFFLDIGQSFVNVFPWLKLYDVSTRLQSLSQEPSYIAFTFAPVVFCALHNLFYRTRYFMNGWWSFLFVVTYLLTQSAIAFTGVVIMLILVYLKNLTLRKLQYSLLAVAGVIMITVGSYIALPGIKIRVDDTVMGFSPDFFEGDKYLRVNPSSYAILSNYYVTSHGFRDHPIVGNGIGTYEVVYDKYIPDKVNWVDRNYMKLNRQDGASMAFRLLVETGLIGLFLFLLFVYRFKIRSRIHFSKEMEVLWILNTGIFVLIMLALLRNGNYTVQGKLLFFLMYYYSYNQVRGLLLNNAGAGSKADPDKE